MTSSNNNQNKNTRIDQLYTILIFLIFTLNVAHVVTTISLFVNNKNNLKNCDKILPFCITCAGISFIMMIHHLLILLYSKLARIYSFFTCSVNNEWYQFCMPKFIKNILIVLRPPLLSFLSLIVGIYVLVDIDNSCKNWYMNNINNIWVLFNSTIWYMLFIVSSYATIFVLKIWIKYFKKKSTTTVQENTTTNISINEIVIDTPKATECKNSNANVSQAFSITRSIYDEEKTEYKENTIDKQCLRAWLATSIGIESLLQCVESKTISPQKMNKSRKYYTSNNNNNNNRSI